VPLFATTLFLSSWLMFALEPMVARTVLPVLGGTPMVWNTCVLFFQILLLAGYAYAHGVSTWLGSRRSGAAYVAVLVLPLLTLPFAIGANAQPPADGGNPIGWLLVVLAKSIGLPFFALAATAPILQRWFADTDHPSANDPYFLYAASNLGSLLALMMYPAISGLRPQYGWHLSYGETADGLMYIGPHRNYPHHLFALGSGGDSISGAFAAARILARAVRGQIDKADEVFGWTR